jgi:hypothetical protein
LTSRAAPAGERRRAHKGKREADQKVVSAALWCVFYSFLFYSFLLYSFLFYSFLFYSFLFYSFLPAESARRGAHQETRPCGAAAQA